MERTRNAIGASKEDYIAFFSRSIRFSNICLHVCKRMFGAEMPVCDNWRGASILWLLSSQGWHFWISLLKLFLAGYLSCTGCSCEKCRLYIFAWT